jgi:hypothetical protein
VGKQRQRRIGKKSGQKNSKINMIAMNENKNLESRIEPILKLYCDLMIELKIRLDSVIKVATTESEIPAQIRYELCYLQLRMICELMALGCLVVHGDVQATRTGKLKKEYAADRIIKTLEKLHPSFYPQPSKQIQNQDGSIAVSPITSGFLTKDAFVKLYAECGDILHRGTFINLGNKIRPHTVSFSRVMSWCQQIFVLLNHHQIAIVDSSYEVWVIMEAKHDGRPYGHLMKKIPFSSLDAKK